MLIRPFTRSDTATVASLHAASWRAAYRGIMADRFLDGALLEDRIAHWREKLAAANLDEWGLFVAEDDGDPIGFACAAPTRNSTWGAFLDNLHLRPDVRGRGLGARLMSRVAEWACDRGDASIHLLVYETNAGARRFYERQGGTVVERLELVSPDGRVIPELRMAWRDLATLMNAASS